MEEKDIKFIQKLDEMGSFINQDKRLRDFDICRDIVRDIQKDKDFIETEKTTDRCLRIGIVGEVKAGKSSFLNALIFDGRDFLPKAPTPMTAALTKIKYSETPLAKVYFYSPEDWEHIEWLNKEYDKRVNEKYDEMMRRWREKEQRTHQEVGLGANMSNPKPTMEAAEKKCRFPDDIKGGKELVEMVRERDLKIDDYLGKCVELDGDVIKKLDDYVGAKGRFTPLVMYSEISLNDEELKDVEIIDTPGLNDPFSSRSEKTKDFLGKCDVVFLLSYTGHFFTQEDVDFLKNEIANANIKKAVLVGSKLDSGILDYNKRKGCSFNYAYNASVSVYKKQARTVLDNCLKERDCPLVLKCLENEQCYFVSSLLYKAGMNLKKGEKYDSDTEYAINNLKQRFGEFEENSKFLFSYAGIDKLKRDVLKTVMADKEKLLSERLADHTDNRLKDYIRKLDDLQDQLVYNLDLLENSDVEDLQRTIDLVTEKLESSNIRVKAIFDDQAVKITKKINRIKLGLSESAEDCTDIHTDVDERTWTTREGGFLGFFKHTVEHYRKTVTADVSEAIVNLRKLEEDCSRKVHSQYDNVISIDELKNDVKTAMLDLFDIENVNLDENDILIPLQSNLNKLTIPSFEISAQDFTSKITTKYPAKYVTNDDIYSYRNDLVESVYGLIESVRKDLDKNIQEIKDKLNIYGSTFVSDVVKTMKKDLDRIKDELKDKQSNICEYKKVIAQVSTWKSELREMKEGF